MIYALGFSLEGRELKAALVSKRGKKITVELMHNFALDDESVDPLKLLSPILIGKRVKIVSSLPASAIILRDLQLPMTNVRKILAVLPFQAETLIPFPPEETVLHPYIRNKNSKQSHIFLTATKKEKISSHLSSLRELRIEPDQVSTSVHALARWSSLYTSPNNASEQYKKIAYLGRHESFFLLMENDQILSTKLLSFPSSSLEKEIKKADEFIHAKFPQVQDCPWILSGDIPLDTPSGSCGLQTTSQEGLFAQHSLFAIAIGLCLESLEPNAMSVQWRQNAFYPEHLLKKQRTQCFVGTAAFVIAATLFGPLGNTVCKYYEKNLLERAHLCLDRIAPGKAHPQNLDTACISLQKHMNALKKEEKLGTFAPKVTELLAWLGACVAEGKSETAPRASIASLNYLLTPTGQVEVRLTLQASPPLAEAFLKKIRQEDSLIDRHKDIIWKKEKTPYYNAQFYLK